MAPKHRSSDTSNLDMPKRSHKVLPLNEKVKVFNLIKIEKNHVLSLLESIIRTGLLSMKL